jgi:phospholipase/carboxylesterase
MIATWRIARHNLSIAVAALLLTRPRLLASAILFRPLSPFRGVLANRLDRIPVLIIDGEKDSRRLPGDGARRLAERLTCAGATVTHHVLPVGHSITAMDREIARVWLATGGV